MRYSRQDKILQLINEHEIETQEALLLLLKENGFNVTQATISRDIKELQLVKTLSATGRYKYTPGGGNNVPSSTSANRYIKIFKSTITSADTSGNIIVLKTLSGCANAAAEAIDSLNFEGVVGSLAGDNTIFVVVNSPEQAPILLSEFQRLMGNE